MMDSATTSPSKKENIRSVFLGRRPKWLPVECPIDPAYGDDAYHFVTYRDALPPSTGGYDLWNAKWEGGPGEQLPYITEHPVDDLKELLSLDFPDPASPELWDAAGRIASEHRENKLIVGRQVSSIWERLYFLVGFENALMALLGQPELVERALGRITDWQIRIADQFIHLEIDLVRISDDYGSQEDLLMSPGTWRDLIKPQLTRLVKHYQAAGVPVALHSCGNLDRIMDDLIELDIAAFNIQTNANDLVKYQRAYGDQFCLWGGVSTQDVLALGTPDQVAKSVRDAISQYGQDGRLILEPDQIVTVPEHNLTAYWSTAREARRELDFAHV